MHRCRCSKRALESFIQDLAGFNLRQQRAQRFFQQHHRRFSARPSLRQSEFSSDERRAADEAFDNFHVPDELLGKWAGTNPEERGVKCVHRDGLHEEKVVEQEGAWTELERPARVEQEVSRPILEMPAISQHMTLPRTEEPTTRKTKPSVSARQLRKLRRIEEGKHPLGRSKSAQNVEESMTSWDKVLEKVDGIENSEGLNNDAVEEDILERKGKNTGTEDEADVEKILKMLGVESRDIAQKSKTKTTKSDTKDTSSTKPPPRPKKEPWQITKSALKAKFGETGWQPRKRLSPDTLEGIRALHASDPTTYSTSTLATHFQITPEAIRRILKSKWQPSSEESEKRMERWERRGARKWGEMAQQGMRPPKRWRAMGVGKEGEERDVGQERRSGGKRKTVAEKRWDEAVDAADRLPMEGSFADRIL